MELTLVKIKNGPDYDSGGRGGRKLPDTLASHKRRCCFVDGSTAVKRYLVGNSSAVVAENDADAVRSYLAGCANFVANAQCLVTHGAAVNSALVSGAAKSNETTARIELSKCTAMSPCDARFAWLQAALLGRQLAGARNDFVFARLNALARVHGEALHRLLEPDTAQADAPPAHAHAHVQAQPGFAASAAQPTAPAGSPDEPRGDANGASAAVRGPDAPKAAGGVGAAQAGGAARAVRAASAPVRSIHDIPLPEPPPGAEETAVRSIDSCLEAMWQAAPANTLFVVPTLGGNTAFVRYLYEAKCKRQQGAGTSKGATAAAAGVDAGVSIAALQPWTLPCEEFLLRCNDQAVQGCVWLAVKP